MRVNELMMTDVQTVPPGMPAATAWEVMRRKRIHHLIVKSDGRIVGVLSEKDAGGRNGAAVRKTATVADLMTRHVVSIHPEATVRRAANLMRGRPVGCFTVVDGDRAIGVVTVPDPLGALGQPVDRPRRQERATLNHRVPHRNHAAAPRGSGDACAEVRQAAATHTFDRRSDPRPVRCLLENRRPD